MRLPLIFLLLSFPCFAATTEAERDQCVAFADGRRAAGITGPTGRAEMVRDCNDAHTGRSTITDEYWAYYVYIASEFEAGRVTQQHGQYLVAQKLNELESRRRPVVVPVPVYPAPLPSCRNFPPGLRGYVAAQGQCY